VFHTSRPGPLNTAAQPEAGPACRFDIEFLFSILDPGMRGIASYRHPTRCERRHAPCCLQARVVWECAQLCYSAYDSRYAPVRTWVLQHWHLEAISGKNLEIWLDITGGVRRRGRERCTQFWLLF
jgi:hypothetical protein